MTTVKLQNLDCANCAGKIEKRLNELDELSNVKLNFATSTLSFEQKSEKNLLDKIENEIQKIEKQVLIIKDETKKQRTFWELLNKKLLLITIISIILTFISYNYVSNKNLQLILYVTAYLLVGRDVIFQAIKNIKNGKVFDEHFLMSIATIGAFALGEYVEGIAVMLFYQIGEMFQAVAVNNSRDNINALIDIKPEFANVKEGENIIQKTPENVKIGDTILVKVGEKVPVDGILLSKKCSFDTSTITGEFKPKTINENEELISGYINISNASYIKVKSLYKDSTIAKIVELIENAASKKASAEKFISKFAAVYTPIVVIFAVLLSTLPPLFIQGAVFTDWIERGLIFLVISCPCALVVSVPLSFFSAIGAISKRGVLVKGANYVEKLTEIRNIVFDKTGTLTHGVFEVTDIKSKLLPEDELLKLAAYSESFSTHPIALSIVKAYGKEIDLKHIITHEEFGGMGIKAIVDNKEVLIGNTKLLTKFNIQHDDVKENLSAILIAIDNVFAGYIVVDDIIKTEAKSIISELKKLNINKTYMLTGDKKEVALNVATALGIDEVKYELLPQEKLTYFEKIKKQTNQPTAFVGDGINDAPALVCADIGIAMGNGTDIAIEAADITLLNGELSNIIKALELSKQTFFVIKRNLFFALIYNIIGIPVAAMGLLSPMIAGTAMAFSSISVLLSSLTLNKFRM